MIGININDEDFKKLENPSADLESENQEFKDKLKTAYENIIDILKEYLDIKEEYFNIIALWIIGTYFHNRFPSYPILYFNAMKGSGKSRTTNLIISLSKDGSMCNSMTEAVLFRTKGTLGIDEFESIIRKGNENLRELINSAYKKGTKVKRMKQVKTIDGITQVVEEFDVYRPIVLANISGMENVLGDRCIPLILDKSNKKEVTTLLELFNDDPKLNLTKKLLEECSLCRCSFSQEVYVQWNTFIKNNYTNYINYTNYTNYTNYNYPLEAFKVIKSMELNGREFELSFPLCLIANEVGSHNPDLLKITTSTIKSIFDDKKEEELVENNDINLIDFISSQLQKDYYISMSSLLKEFKESFAITEEWVNVKWLGRALKRLNLIKYKRRTDRGIEVILDYEKAKRQIILFKK